MTIMSLTKSPASPGSRNLARRMNMDEHAKKTAQHMIPYEMVVLTNKSKEGQEVGAATINWITQTSILPPW